MAQNRFINFGDTVLARRINEISTAIVSKGVLEGGSFSVGLTSNTLRVGPNKAMLDELLLVENGNTDLMLGFGTPPTLPQDSTDWTIVYEHINQNVQGGVPATMLALEGLFGFEDLENTTVLGWVRYPGGGVPLNPTMFVEAPKLQLSNPTEFSSNVKVPPFVPNIYIQSESPSVGAISASDEYDVVNLKAFMELENTAAAINTIQHYVPFVAGVRAPNRILLEASVDLGASVKAALVSEDGTVFPAENDTITNTSNVFVSREMTIVNVDVTKFQQNRPYFVSITTQLNPGKRAFLSIVGTSSNFLPF